MNGTGEYPATMARRCPGGNKKAGIQAGFGRCSRTSGFESADTFVQAALVTRGLVMVDESLVGDAVNDRHGLPVSGFGFRFLAFSGELHHFLDVTAHHGTQGGVVLTMDHGLAGALLRLLGISQGGDS